jgi:LuxR family maltose regulon positive regulatory protein
VGELKFFRGVLLFWQGEGEPSCTLLEEARDRIPGSCLRVRGLLEIYLAQARQMSGNGRMAIEAIRNEPRDSTSLAAPWHSRVLLAQAFVHAVSGDLGPAAEQARRAKTVANEVGIPQVTGWAGYLQAASAFRSDDLETAIRHFSAARTDPYDMHTRSAVDALVGLALAEHALGRSDIADDTMAQLLAFAQATENPEHLAAARSGRARLALAREDVDAAARWAEMFEEEDRPATTLFIWLDNPVLTWIRVLTEVGSPDGLERASLVLERVQDELESIHNTCQLIDVAVLRSLVLHRDGRSVDALEALARAVAMAEPGRWVRPFAEPGPLMVSLLERLVEGSDDHHPYARRLLAKLNGVASTVDF